jgi:hypothetical protein
MSPLSANQEQMVGRASVQALEQTFASLFNPPRRRSWLVNSNRYLVDCVGRIEADKRANAVVQADLGQYIAASAPLHCADGWTLLGRALGSHLRGDRDTARHLAYYAELRAAVSLLASAGLGIFDKDHFVLDASGSVLQFPGRKGTHVATWEILTYWAGLPVAGDLLTGIVSAGGRTLRQWLDAFSAGVTGALVATDWLRGWGLDLKRLSEDRDARNDSSYRPTRLSRRRSWDVVRAADFAAGLWTICEPAPPSGFEALDRHLVRLSLGTVQNALAAARWRRSRREREQFRLRVTQAVAGLAPAGLSEDEWVQFLTRQAQPDDPVPMLAARRQDPADHPRHHLQLMSRALLLLRVATGASSRLLRVSSVGRDRIHFWWGSLGRDMGLWEPGGEPDDCSDLWADVGAAVDEVHSWVADGAVQKSSQSLLNEHPRALSLLGEGERVALWGLSL